MAFARCKSSQAAVCLPQEMSNVINYARDMEQMASLPGAPQGIPKVTINGGQLEADNKRRELSELFRWCRARIIMT